MAADHSGAETDEDAFSSENESDRAFINNSPQRELHYNDVTPQRFGPPPGMRQKRRVPDTPDDSDSDSADELEIIGAPGHNPARVLVFGAGPEGEPEPDPEPDQDPEQHEDPDSEEEPDEINELMTNNGKSLCGLLTYWLSPTDDESEEYEVMRMVVNEDGTPNLDRLDKSGDHWVFKNPLDKEAWNKAAHNHFKRFFETEISSARIQNARHFVYMNYQLEVCTKKKDGNFGKVHIQGCWVLDGDGSKKVANNTIRQALGVTQGGMFLIATTMHEAILNYATKVKSSVEGTQNEFGRRPTNFKKGSFRDSKGRGGLAAGGVAKENWVVFTAWLKEQALAGVSWEDCLEQEPLCAAHMNAAKELYNKWRAVQAGAEHREELSILTLRPWQEDLLLAVTDPDRNTRELHIVWDEQGHAGKSVFSAILQEYYGALLQKGGLCTKDLQHLFVTRLPKIMVFDYPRAHLRENMHYTFIEKVLDGHAESGKYQGFQCLYNKIPVIVFCNNLPYDRWSIDRYVIWKRKVCPLTGQGLQEFDCYRNMTRAQVDEMFPRDPKRQRVVQDVQLPNGSHDPSYNNP